MITKPLGYDWEVTYAFEDDAPETMEVYGQITVEDALREARCSLSAGELFSGQPMGYAILSVTRR